MRIGMQIPVGQTPLCPAAYWLELHLYGASALGRYNKQIQALNGDAGRPGASPRFITLPLTKEGLDLIWKLVSEFHSHSSITVVARGGEYACGVSRPAGDVVWKLNAHDETKFRIVLAQHLATLEQKNQEYKRVQAEKNAREAVAQRKRRCAVISKLTEQGLWADSRALLEQALWWEHVSAPDYKEERRVPLSVYELEELAALLDKVKQSVKEPATTRQ